MNIEAVEEFLYAYFHSFLKLNLIISVVFIFIFITILVILGHKNRVLNVKAIKNTIANILIFMIGTAMCPLTYYLNNFMLSVYETMKIPSIPANFWSETDLYTLSFISLIIKDFADYWSHRFMHTKIGWPTHLVHHSDSHVNGFTAFRIHFLESVVMNLFYILLLSWIGIKSEIVAVLYMISLLHNNYVHFEVDIDHGPFNWLLASPRFHRWHHADTPEAYGKNLANIFPIWDILFGTYYKAGKCDAPMGALSAGIPDTDLVKLMILPFQLWYRQSVLLIRNLINHLHFEFDRTFAGFFNVK